ncbi:hypothetical protein PV04_02146 [Phialophora macrospora]|uniref:Uncharacterized protein n=1 Tax=Phialophora macrospora TaxID=1851006 RepID=A0A0D2GCI4_9EURO|nr:hypothetical protein PV04_02146 [Phialophora macrospora]
MSSQTNAKLVEYFFPFMLVFHRALASPVPEIFPPEADTLSFTELALKTFFRILELGFIRGIAASLFILCCLVCLLVCTLRALAVYLHRQDAKLWETYEEIQACDDGEKEGRKEAICRRSSVVDECRPYHLQGQKQSRNSRYILANPSTPVTKINVHASPRRAAVTMSPSSPSKTNVSPPIRSPSTPLRSALSKSPPLSNRLPNPQCYFFGSHRTSTSTSTSTTSSPSPKSVRWADQVHVSFTTIEMSVQRQPGGRIETVTQAEMDIASGTVGNDYQRQSDVSDFVSSPVYHAEPPPTYGALPPRSVVPFSDRQTESSMVSFMLLDGDTS